MNINIRHIFTFALVTGATSMLGSTPAPGNACDTQMLCKDFYAFSLQQEDSASILYSLKHLKTEDSLSIRYTNGKRVTSYYTPGRNTTPACAALLEKEMLARIERVVKLKVDKICAKMIEEDSEFKQLCSAHNITIDKLSTSITEQESELKQICFTAEEEKKQ